MNIEIVMPYHGEARFRLASWVRLRLEALHPSWRLLVGVDGGEPWTKARAVNRAVSSRAEVIVVTDADVAVPAKALEWAVAAVIGGAAWAVPYGTVYRLHREQTAEVLAASPVAEIEVLEDGACVRHRPPYDATPGGGVFVVAREAWETVGGFDERFVWGQEDAPLGHALDTLAGPHEQLPAPLWHLWHEPRPPTQAMYDDQRLENCYHAARGDVEAMRRLIAGRRPALDGLAAPASR